MGSEIDSKFGGPLHCGYGTRAVRLPLHLIRHHVPAGGKSLWIDAKVSRLFTISSASEPSENLKSGIGCALDALCGSLTSGGGKKITGQWRRAEYAPFKHLAPPVDVNGSIDFCHSHVAFSSLDDLSLSNKIGHSCWFEWIINLQISMFLNLKWVKSQLATTVKFAIPHTCHVVCPILPAIHARRKKFVLKRSRYFKKNGWN